MFGKKDKKKKPYPMPDESVQCHYTGFEKSCKDIVSKHTCPKYMLLKGTNPQTGEDIDEWGCADMLMPFVHLQQDMRSFQTVTALESLRNELVNHDREIIRTLEIAHTERKRENDLLEAKNATLAALGYHRERDHDKIQDKKNESDDDVSNE